MFPEVKHFIYNGLITPQDYFNNLVYDPNFPAFGITGGYTSRDTGSTELGSSCNFLMVFRPDYCLPQTEGTTDSTIIGTKYNWLNTMIELNFTPNLKLLNLMHNPFVDDLKFFNATASADSYDLNLPARTLTLGQRVNTLSNPTYQYRVTGDNDNDLAQIVCTDNIVDKNRNCLRVEAYNESGGTSARPGYILYPYEQNANIEFAREVPMTATSTLNQPASDNNGLAASTGTIVPHNAQNSASVVVNTDDGNIYTTTTLNNFGTPLYMAPAYKPYFYCRLIFFKFKFGLTDYASFVTSTQTQCNFLNSLWFDKKDNNAITAATSFHSVRSNDLAVDNPFGGSFDIVYNKLLKINPFKEYRFRLNLQSKSKRGDVVTISSPNPYLTPDTDIKLLKGAQYFGFILPPTCLNDFDPVLQQCIYRTSLVNPLTHSFIDAHDARSSVNVPVDAPYVGPYPQDGPSYGGERLGQRLQLTSSIALRTRTAYTDS